MESNKSPKKKKPLNLGNDNKMKCMYQITKIVYVLSNQYVRYPLFTHMTLDGTMNPQVKNINENKLYPNFLEFFGRIF